VTKPGDYTRCLWPVTKLGVYGRLLNTASIMAGD